MELIRVLLVDDHQVVRMGLEAILTKRNGFEVVGEAENGREAIRMALELEPDIILMDLRMPEVDGYEAATQIKAQNPDVRILVLTSYYEPDRIAPVMAAGASGYVLKESSADELKQAIHSIYNGNIILSPEIMEAIANASLNQAPGQPDIEALTPREKEVLQGIVDGLTNRGIAYKLGIRDTTVRSHVSTILAKLNVSNRTQAAVVAQERALL